MLLKELLFLNIIIITGTTSTHCYGSMHWTWSCINGSCLRSSTPYDKNGTSLNICRMLCGKYGSLWPIPTGKAVLGNGFYYFHSSKIKFDYSKVAGEAAKNYLTKVSTIFQSKLDKTCGDECIFIPRTEINITFNVMLPQMTLNWNTDESYTLDISKSEFSSDGNNIVDVKIKSKSVYGARHALETLTQLTTLYTPFPCNGQTNSTLVIVSSAQLTDSPAYSHRGLVLDTARHYIPVKSIYKTLDAMAMTKLNIFHWHVTDSQSFPLEIPRVPQLLWYGAYSQDLVYTVADTKAIVEYAKLRGIRVILEVDAPAHAGNGWQWGEDYNLGKLALCVNQLPWRKYCIQPPCGQLNPVNVNLFDVLKKMFADIIEMLPSGEAFHMGGDEVFFPCWNSSIEVIHWMENNLLNRTEADFLYLWSLYQNTTLSLFDEINPVTDVPIILWSSKLTDPEVIEQFLDKDR
ncbi:hypothetical protein RUM44_002930 [Polyplax serrata]|uniref:beta-N-acetylhexosaminidase n=1 Tax=Polyplax serrata TaxID=468196 RepID=A0ABR1AX36_POLSC